MGMPCSPCALPHSNAREAAACRHCPQALLAILDSPLNKAGRLKALYVHTAKNVLIQVNPQASRLGTGGGEEAARRRRWRGVSGREAQGWRWLAVARTAARSKLQQHAGRQHP